MQTLQHFDFFVIGGGSAGLAAAKEATKYGIKVGLADYVRPTPIGTKWGIGGTCVNVGCIPKKLFHQAGYLGHEFTYLQRAGYDITKEKPKHDWATLVQNVTDNIKSSNWKSTVAMRDKNIKYFNKFASLKPGNHIELVNPKGEIEQVTSKYILIATGGRPTYPDIPGARELGITSDDIFWRKENPGKTLVVGASYIALETAGFMQELGIDVTVMVRSIFLRGFDQQMSNKVADYMGKIGVKFLRDSVPISIVKTEGEGNWKTVKFQTSVDGKTKESEENYETVLFAIGRSAETKNMGLEELGMKLAKNGKIIVNQSDQTSVDNVFALGDVVDGRLELTPPAIVSGKLLAHRLFGESKQNLDYHYLPTTIFTPLEYGACGYSEEDAIKAFGKQNIVSYGSKYHPFEWDLDDFAANDCYAKLVVHKNDKQIPNRVIGIHYLGPHAGEVIQGYSVAVKKGISKNELDISVGIHPTSAEEFTLMTAIAGSPDEEKQGCCS